MQDEETLLEKIQYKRIASGDVIYQGKFDWNILLGMIGIISEISGVIKKETLKKENND